MSDLFATCPWISDISTQLVVKVASVCCIIPDVLFTTVGFLDGNPYACLARTGLAKAKLSYSYENKLEGMIIQKHQKYPKANKEKNLLFVESEGGSALIAREVLDVVESFRIGGWDDGLDGDGGGAEKAVLNGFLVLWVSVRSGDLPLLLHVTS
ncbi:hypothetical protein LOK49_LG06G02319 [Camellia lanceoleosa]|uniref:Uncharacterized protein n=1 Tax=Camellia lanceoleosa TaxID=1840588 RepID=A0ACC0H9J1_9ERIC|nr:hypothetical protein LOK49_LG06G02319 [Camellia lanceoleosa]